MRREALSTPAPEEDELSSYYAFVAQRPAYKEYLATPPARMQRHTAELLYSQLSEDPHPLMQYAAAWTLLDSAFGSNSWEERWHQQSIEWAGYHLRQTSRNLDAGIGDLREATGLNQKLHAEFDQLFLPAFQAIVRFKYHPREKFNIDWMPELYGDLSKMSKGLLEQHAIAKSNNIKNAKALRGKGHELTTAMLLLSQGFVIVPGGLHHDRHPSEKHRTDFFLIEFEPNALLHRIQVYGTSSSRNVAGIDVRAARDLHFDPEAMELSTLEKLVAEWDGRGTKEDSEMLARIRRSLFHRVDENRTTHAHRLHFASPKRYTDGTLVSAWQNYLRLDLSHQKRRLGKEVIPQREIARQRQNLTTARLHELLEETTANLNPARRALWEAVGQFLAARIDGHLGEQERALMHEACKKGLTTTHEEYQKIRNSGDKVAMDTALQRMQFYEFGMLMGLPDTPETSIVLPHWPIHRRHERHTHSDVYLYQDKDGGWQSQPIDLMQIPEKRLLDRDDRVAIITRKDMHACLLLSNGSCCSDGEACTVTADLLLDNYQHHLFEGRPLRKTQRNEVLNSLARGIHFKLASWHEDSIPWRAAAAEELAAQNPALLRSRGREILTLIELASYQRDQARLRRLYGNIG